MHTEFWSEGFKEKTKSEYVGEDRIILKLVIKTGMGMEWIHPTQ
jgi:hypothetical protein